VLFVTPPIEHIGRPRERGLLYHTALMMST
jgi:hypothetical protein